MVPSASVLACRREERVQKAVSVDHHGAGDARLSAVLNPLSHAECNYVQARDGGRRYGHRSRPTLKGGQLPTNAFAMLAAAAPVPAGLVLLLLVGGCVVGWFHGAALGQSVRSPRTGARWFNVYGVGKLGETARLNVRFERHSLPIARLQLLARGWRALP